MALNKILALATVGVSSVSALSIFGPSSSAGAANKVEPVNTDPCCKSCPDGKLKYFSVDMPHGHCGEACIDPHHFRFFKIFEANLTLADGGKSDNACAKQFTGDGRHWSVYQQTVTHGDPFGIVAVTLDLYGAGANMTATANAVEGEGEVKTTVVKSSKADAMSADLTETVEFV